MKRIALYFLLFISLCSSGCSDTGSTKKESPKSNVAEIKFENEKIETGVFDGKSNVTANFKFWNNGGIPLVIHEAKGNCHCVHGMFAEQPIKPGDSSVINVSFDPAGVTGLFVRTMMIKSNATRPEVELTITGEIKRDSIK